MLLALVLLLVGGMTLVGLIWKAQQPPEGVRPVVWDKESCAECGMAVSTPGFAAQLQTEDGRVFDFDDPGCLFLYLINNQPAVRAAYFHAMSEDRWLSRDEVGFVSTDRSPMGYDLGTVRGDTPGALTFEQALEKIRRRRQSKGG